MNSDIRSEEDRQYIPQYMHGVCMISYRKIFHLCSPFNDFLNLSCVNND